MLTQQILIHYPELPTKKIQQNSPPPTALVSVNPTRTLAGFKIPDRGLSTTLQKSLITKHSQKGHGCEALCLFFELTFVQSLRHAFIPLLIWFSHAGKTPCEESVAESGWLSSYWLELELKPGVHDTRASQAYLSFLQMDFLSGNLFLAALACSILVPWPGIEPAPSAVKAQRLNHWITREFPWVEFFVLFCFCWTEHCVLVTSPRWVFQTLLPTASWYWSHQGKYNAVKYWMKQYTTYIENRQQDQLQ